MITRAFFILGLIFSLSIFANESARLRLSGRVYPQIQVSVVSTSSASSNIEDTYRVRSNMSGETYRVFFENAQLSQFRNSKGQVRHLVIEAK